MKNLSEKTIVVNLVIKGWSARKYDKKVTQKIEEAHNAKDAGRFNKLLLAAGTGVSNINSVGQKARQYLYDNTLVWGDNGDRLLPSELYFTFIAEFNRFKAEYQTQVSKFLQDYPTLKEEARLRLNGMYKEEDYPTVKELVKKFSMECTFVPIANLDDFRLSITQDERDALKLQIEGDMNDRLKNTGRDILRRIKDVVFKMVDKLSNSDATFHNTLITNIEDLIDVLPKLNITNDSEIEDIIDKMRRLVDVRPDTLRTNTNIRNQKAQEAKAIFAQVDTLLGI